MNEFDLSEFGGASRSAGPGRGLIQLGLLLAFSSSGIVQKFLGLAGVAGYVAGVVLVLVLVRRFGGRVAPWVRRHFGWLSGVSLAVLALCFAVGYPIENGRGPGKSSDREDALNLAVTRMEEGQSPYYPSSKIAGPLSVLPGAIVLSAPFVAVGNSAYQNFFWLAAFLGAVWWNFRDRALALVMLTVPLALSPAAIYEFVSGGDMLANGIYVAVIFLLALRAWSNSQACRWSRWAACVLLGLGLASRPNFLLLLPLFGAVLWRTVGLRQAVAAAGLVVVVSATITLPLYLHDPAGFTPLLARNKLAIIDDVLPWASNAILGMTALLGILGAWSLVRTTGSDLNRWFFRWCALVTLCPMVCAVGLFSWGSGRVDFDFMRDRFGLMYVFFALLGWGGQMLGVPCEQGFLDRKRPIS